MASLRPRRRNFENEQWLYKDGATNLKDGFGCSTGAANVNNVNGELLRQPGSDITNDGSEDTDFRLQLAINTNQFDRTFQDRTHSYAVRQQTDEMKTDCKRLYTLNVREKRGNIVQTYPSTEYNFVPNILEVSRGDCVHFQWTGSNTNPNNNDGQGTDRSNVAVLEKVRGEGGRGVSRFGGKGKGGTTWTTADMELGYEGFKVDQAPTMFDLQCDNVDRRADGMVYNVPYGGWQYCTNCNNAIYNDATKPIKPGPSCEGGYSLNQDVGVCVRNDNACRFERRITNPATYSGMGLANQERDFTGYSQQQIGSPDSMKFGSWGGSHPEHLDNVTAWMVWGVGRSQANNLATLKDVQFRGEMSELDDAGTYFDMLPRRITGALGSSYYMCTSNNNSSNRSQKGKVVVSDAVQECQPYSAVGCSISSADEITMNIETMDTSVDIPSNAISAAMDVSVEVMVNKRLPDGAPDVVMIGSTSVLSSVKVAQNVQMMPDSPNTMMSTAARDRLEERRARSITRPGSGGEMAIKILAAAAITYGPVHRWPSTAERSMCMEAGNCELDTSDPSDRVELEGAECSSGKCTVKCTKNYGGYYQVSSASLVPMIIGCGSAFYFRRNPEKWEELKAWDLQKYTKLKRSVQNRL